MADVSVDAYIVPTEDPHMSEYPPDCYKRREYITNFTGSAGTAVVTAKQALLWTDGRYFLQAEQELTRSWTLMRAGTPTCPDIERWLADNLPRGSRVGIDPLCHTIASASKISRVLKEAGLDMVPLNDNLVDVAWGPERPPFPTPPVRVHPLQWAGQDVPSKLASIRAKMEAAKADVLVITMLDEVAWLLNLRGSDVSYNPVFVSYAMVTKEGAAVYLDGGKVGGEAQAQLQQAGVEVKGYGEIIGDLKQKVAGGARLWMDPSKVSLGLLLAAAEVEENGPRGKGRKRTAGGSPKSSPPKAVAAADISPKIKPVELPSPVVTAKALKNEAELAGMREAHLRDAVAICQFLSWFESQVAGGRTFTEVEVDEYLTGKRAQQPGFIEPSFPTIAGAGPNGAVIHYRAKAETCRTVDSSTLLLIDSGGQYDCGTTDITRTIHLGTPTAHQKRCFTRVLQGYISLDTAIFPEGTPGLSLDTLARQHLWKEGLNYRHGTGHGVGAALNVHEGPMSISTRLNITTPLEPNMVVSNEPGYYEDGAFGIRTENLLVVELVDTPFRYAGQDYYGFEALTLVPIQTKMMDLDLMTPEEIQWVNTYHARVWETVSPRMAAGEALDWLRVSTQPLPVASKAPEPVLATA